MAGLLCVAITAMQDEVCIANCLILCRKLRCDTGYFHRCTQVNMVIKNMSTLRVNLTKLNKTFQLILVNKK